MIRRPRRSIPATIVAAVILAICVLVIVAVVQSLLGQPPFVSGNQLLAVSSSQHWNSAATVAVAIVLAVLGVVLLIAALRPGKPTVLPLVSQIGGTPASTAGVRRATLTKDLTATVEAVPGVDSATVSARRGRITANLQVAAADPAAVPEQVRERLEQRIAEIGPATRPRIRVRARAANNT